MTFLFVLNKKDFNFFLGSVLSTPIQFKTKLIGFNLF